MALSTPIVQIIDRDPVAVDVEQRISEAIRLLSSERYHHLPVVDGQRLVGLLSATDIIELSTLHTGSRKMEYAAAVELDKQYRIEDVMKTDLITITDRATVGEAAQKLSPGGYHALPVVDEHGDLIGIVTTTDLISHMLVGPSHEPVPAAVQHRAELLEQVLEAARHYLNSGQGAREHAQLLRAVEAALSHSDETVA
jgi:CBS domain-containing protein